MAQPYSLWELCSFQHTVCWDFIFFVIPLIILSKMGSNVLELGEKLFIVQEEQEDQQLHTCMPLPFTHLDGFTPGPWGMLQCSQDDLTLYFYISFVQLTEIFCFSIHVLFSGKLCQYRKNTWKSGHHTAPSQSICWMRSVPKHSQLALPTSPNWCYLKIAIPWSSIFTDFWSVTSNTSKTKKAACLNVFPLPSLSIKLLWTEAKKMCLIGIFTCDKKKRGGLEQ